MDLSKLYTILEDEYLWFNHVTNFDDPYEGVYSEKTAKKIAEMHVDWFDLSEEEALKKAKAGNLSSYVNCWTNSPHQSVALWEKFVEGNKGVAIKTRASNLRAAITDKRRGTDYISFRFGKVEYTDYEETMPRGISAPVYHKRNSFDYEKEYRVVISNYLQSATEGAPTITSDGVEWPYDPGLEISIDVNELVESVYISPTADSYFPDVVGDIVDNSKIDVEVIQSDLFDDPMQ
ncbi:hypothetical protein EA462_01025 [Natrarchaeobius halalkaliphilus]|uniref:DUF2971 domain-containing protein n=2 Tax=Natrarchaeobius halalkaliphilus TaxID=1679091 RepID=A0A3N6P4G8_9EURY|nr:hypothetical protein EA462_01025 [Natrarchaeobius halalkaliphilus]